MTVRFWLFHPARSAMLASCDKRSASVEASRSLGSERPSAGPFCRLKLSAQLMIVLHGRYDEARSLFERLLSRCNDVGLLAEEFDPLTGRMLGNFPQAYCHVAKFLGEIYCEGRSDYSRTCTSFAASISVRANHWPRSVNRTEPCRRFVITENMPSRARSATVTPEMCLPSGAPHQQPLRLSRPLLLKHSIKAVRLASERRPTGACGLVVMNGSSVRLEVIVASFLNSDCFYRKIR